MNRLIAITALACACALAQVPKSGGGATSILYYATSPVGASCSQGTVALYNGGLYPCTAGTYAALTAPVSAGVASFKGRTGAVVAVSGDYTATQTTNTPAGTVAATNVQTAINELDTEKQAVLAGTADVPGLDTALAAKISTAADASLGSVTITPTSDRQAVTARANNSGQSSYISEIQDSSNGFLWGARVDGSHDWKTMASNPITNPSSGRIRLFFHGTDGLCWLTSAGTRVCAASSSGLPADFVLRLTTGTELTGQSGTATLMSLPGDVLAVRGGTSPSYALAGIGGHLGGASASAPTVIGFNLTGNASQADKAITFSKANSSTSTNLLAKMTVVGSAQQAVTATTGDGLTTPVWPCASGCGTTLSGEFTESGHGVCIADASGSVNQYLVNSVSGNGKCHPVTTPTAGSWVVGQLTNAPSGDGQTANFKSLSKFWPSSLTLPGSAGFVYGDGSGGLSAVTDVLSSASSIAATQLPDAGAAKGAVKAKTCTAGQFITDLGVDSTCAAPTGSTATVALKTTAAFTAATYSNDGSSGTNIGTTETALATTYLIPASTLASGKRYRVTFTGATSTVGATITLSIKLRTATTSGGIAAGTVIASSTQGTFVSGTQTNKGMGASWIISGPAAAGASAATYTQSTGGTAAWASGSSFSNGTAQPVNLATNADIYLGLTVTFNATTAAAAITAQDFLVEALN